MLFKFTRMIDEGLGFDCTGFVTGDRMRFL